MMLKHTQDEVVSFAEAERVVLGRMISSWTVSTAAFTTYDVSHGSHKGICWRSVDLNHIEGSCR